MLSREIPLNDFEIVIDMCEASRDGVNRFKLSPRKYLLYNTTDSGLLIVSYQVSGPGFSIWGEEQYGFSNFCLFSDAIQDVLAQKRPDYFLDGVGQIMDLGIRSDDCGNVFLFAKVPTDLFYPGRIKLYPNFLSESARTDFSIEAIVNRNEFKKWAQQVARLRAAVEKLELEKNLTSWDDD